MDEDEWAGVLACWRGRVLGARCSDHAYVRRRQGTVLRDGGRCARSVTCRARRSVLV